MNDEDLDRLLSRMETPPLPLGLRTRVLAHAPRPRVGFWRALGGMKIAGPAFALAMALGVGLGSGLPVPPDDAEFDDVDQWSALADDYSDYGS